MTSNIPGTGRAKSCTACRQVKLACDSRVRFPLPCTRCSIHKPRQLECKFDASFKRVKTRQRLEELTGQLNELQASVRPATSLSPSASASNSSAPQHARSNSPTSEDDDVLEDEFMASSWLQIDGNEETSSRCIEMIILTPETVVDLLRHFERHYYPHLPILRPLRSISSLVENCPVLFWSIILLASRWHPSHSGLYNQLSGPHERALNMIIHTSIQSIDTIHALLLLCRWPTPKLRESYDPSWNYIGIAINAAMQMGLHQPFAKLEAMKGWTGLGDWTKDDLDSRTKALSWLACFNTGVDVSTYLGLPPPLSTANHLNRIASICRRVDINIPRSFAAVTEIHRIVGRYNTELDDLQDHQSHQSLTEMFDGDLDAVKNAYPDVWTPQLDVDLQKAKLYLYALSFTLPSTKLPSPQQISFRKTILNRGLTAATRLIATVSQLHTKKSMLTDASNTNQRTNCNDLYYPKGYFTGLFFATVFLLKFLATQNSAVSRFDSDSAINSVTVSHKIFQDFSNSRDHMRGALVIEVLGRMTRSGVGAGEFGLAITNRLGASLTLDASFRATRYRNTNPHNGAVGSASTWVTVNELDILPLAPEQVVRESVPWLQNPGLNKLPPSNHGSVGSDVILQSIEYLEPGDQGWSWGFWDNEVFDHYKLMDAGYVSTGDADLSHLAGMYSQ